MKCRIFIFCIALFLNMPGIDAFEKKTAEYDYLSAYIRSPQMNNGFGELFRLYSDNTEIFHGKTGKTNTTENQAVRGELDELIGINDYLSNIHPDQIAMMESSWDRLAFFINLFNSLTIEMILEEDWDRLHHSIKKEGLSLEDKFERFYGFDRFFSLDRFEFPEIGLLSLNDIMFGIIFGDEDYLNQAANFAPDKAKKLRDFHRLILQTYPDPFIDFRVALLLNNFSGIGNSIDELPIRRAVLGKDLKDPSFLDGILRKFFNDPDKGVKLKYDTHYWITIRYHRIRMMVPYLFSFFEGQINKKYGSYVNFLLEYIRKDYRDSGFIRWLRENPQNHNEVVITYRFDSNLLKERTF